MHRPRTLVPRLGRAALVTSALSALVLFTAALAPTAYADDDIRRPRRANDWLEVPDVSTQREADAIRSLESLGLTCRTEHVAHDQVGYVIGSAPGAGAWIERGHEVVLRVGAPALVQTIVPKIRRRHIDKVVRRYGEVYAIAINPVRGLARHEGRVVGQFPRAGETLPYRGLLTLDVVDNSTMVPYVEGLGLRRAIRRIERAGLRASIREVPRIGIDRPTVLSQRTRAGRRVPYDSEVRLRVAVPAPIHGGHGNGHDDHGHGHGRGHGHAHGGVGIDDRDARRDRNAIALGPFRIRFR